MEKVNLTEKLGLINDHWNPRVVAALNGQEVKLVKFKGEFPWHKHEAEDEMFMVIKGSFKMEFRDHSIELSEQEFLVVPKNTEHRPVAIEEVSVLLFEPANTLNTGNVVNEFTRKEITSI